MWLRQDYGENMNLRVLKNLPSLCELLYINQMTGMETNVNNHNAFTEASYRVAWETKVHPTFVIESKTLGYFTLMWLAFLLELISVPKQFDSLIC